MSLLDKIFGRKNKKPFRGQKSEPYRLPTLQEFPDLNREERMSVIMALGDTGRVEFFPFLKHALELDPDRNVKFAALKRIHNFKDHPETNVIITAMRNAKTGEQLEPYFSMALMRLGLISLQEFEDKVNNSK